MKEFILITESIVNFVHYSEKYSDKVIISGNIINDLKKILNGNNKEFNLFVLFLSNDEWKEATVLLSSYTFLEYRGIVISPTSAHFTPYALINILNLRTTEISNTEFKFLVERAFFYMKKNQSLIRDNIGLLELKDTYHDQGLLVSLGKHLTTQKNPEELLRSILYLSKKITGADGGTIYLVKKNKQNGKKELIFKVSHTYSLDLPYEELKIDLNDNSIAGHVALTGDVLNISDVYQLSLDNFPDLKHNISFDNKYGYITKSLLVVPMRNHLKEITGVIQLINCKENLDNGNWSGNEAFSIKLNTKEDFENKVYDFDRRYDSLLEAIASQTAIALENIKLISQIKVQFDEFVKASVAAIESRDPATSGHSLRVSKLCIGMVKAINSIKKGPLAKVFFTDDQITEIEYAALLHDFGKVNIDYNLLLKAKKLFPKDFLFLQLKLDYLYRSLQYMLLRKKMSMDGRLPVKFNTEYSIDKINEKLKTIEEIKQLIKKINEPHIDGHEVTELFSQIIEEVNDLECYDLDGNIIQIIDEKEKRNLTAKRGSLNEIERKEIEKHVYHTYSFVCQIPWPQEFKNIPEITYKHHELLDGSGYPQGLKGKDNIPIQSRIMTIADIFDALTAADRPYKKAVPLKKALEILKEESENNKIDKDLLDVFINKKIYNILKS